MTFKTLGILASVGLLAFTALPAAAATAIPAKFNFTIDNVGNNVSDGNVRDFQSTNSPDVGVFNVRVTGWSLEGSMIRDSKLHVWSGSNGGLGVVSGDDGDGGGNRHTIDNQTRRDFIILQFDRRVTLVNATFNTFGIGPNNHRDSDATIRFGNTALPYTTSLAYLNDDPASALNALFGLPIPSNPYVSAGPANQNSTRPINPNEYSGNIWLIGAAFNNPDSKLDGFKLSSLTVIPEPGTWAMMIGGFGLVGAALRRRARHEAAIA